MLKTHRASSAPPLVLSHAEYSSQLALLLDIDWGGECPGADTRPAITDKHDEWFANRPIIGPDATHAQRYGVLAAFM